MFFLPSSVLVGLLLGVFLVFLIFCAHGGFWDYLFTSRVSLVRSWVSPFECGCLSGSSTCSYLGISYLVLLVFFVIFDLELVLILNVPYQAGLYKSFWYYLFFLTVLVLGYSAEACKGYADWAG